MTEYKNDIEAQKVEAEENTPPLPYKFSFTAAVEKARKDYPEVTKNVVFIDLSAPDARQQVLEAISKISPPPSGEDVESFMKEFSKHLNSDGFVNDCGGMSFLFATSHPKRGFYHRKYPEQAAAYCFAHELGHLVVKGGRHAEKGSAINTLWMTNFSETAADSFAMITGLNEGWLTPNDIIKISLERAMNGWISKGLSHMTTIALDDIVVRVEDIVPLPLTPDEIKAIAYNHTLEFMLPREVMNNTFNQLARLSPADSLKSLEANQHMALECAGAQENMAQEMADIMQRHTRILAEACMSEPHTSASFHLYGRVLAKILRTGKIEGVMIDTSDPFWDKLRKDLVEKSYAAGLSDVFKLTHPEVPEPAEKLHPRKWRSNHTKNQA